MAYLKLIIFCYFVLLFHCSFSQQKDSASGIVSMDTSLKLRVNAINISGNKRTKFYIILREIQFKPGDSLITADLIATLEQARRQVYNLNLFSEVTVTPVMLSANEIAVNVVLREKWYIYPTPQFQLVDRNFNDWLKTYHADFNRVVYGLKFSHYNFSGRGDQLRIFLLNGYSRNLSFSYTAPSINLKWREGFRIFAGYTQNREIFYKTSYNNKLLQFKKEGFVRNIFSTGVSYQVRQGFFKRHLFSLSYTYMDVNDSVVTSVYNPDYFNTAKSYKGLLDLTYSFSYSNTDNNNYPLVGKTYRYSISKRGLGIKGGINMLLIDGSFSKYIAHFNNKLNSSIQLYGRIKAPFTQPYINLRGLGYGDIFLRGQEYYVIDGVVSAVAKYTLKKKLFSFNIPVPFKIRAVPRIPFTFFAKTYADAGYSYIKKQFDSKLNNRFLYTGGFGLDILSLYDININLEYSFNQLGENGLFLHTKGGF
jgi:outer membrane protein assembly factor BamA